MENICSCRPCSEWLRTLFTVLITMITVEVIMEPEECIMAPLQADQDIMAQAVPIPGPQVQILPGVVIQVLLKIV